MLKAPAWWCHRSPPLPPGTQGLGPLGRSTPSGGAPQLPQLPQLPQTPLVAYERLPAWPGSTLRRRLRVPRSRMPRLSTAGHGS